MIHKTPVEGDTVYLKRHGNAARHSQDMIVVTVGKVGRKYFDVIGSVRAKFYIESGQQKSDYPRQYTAYTQKELLVNLLEREKLIGEILGKFNPMTLKSVSLEDLRASMQMFKTID